MARIVIAEDEVIVARSIAKLLAAEGHEVPATVTSGADAVAATLALRPDLVLMDIHLRGPQDGIDATLELRRTLDVPVVFLTAYGDRAHLDRAKQAAPHGYLIKPYSDRELLTTIEVALHKRTLEREIAERGRWLGNLLHSIGDGVVAVDLDLRVVSLNAAAEKLTGWPEAEARGRPITDVVVLVAESGGAAIEIPLRQAIADRTVQRSGGITLLAARDGSRVPIDDSAAAVIDDSGAVRGGVVVFRDITERRALERQLALSERMASLATLTAGVGHELNNPLAGSLGNLELVGGDLAALRASLPDPPPAARALLDRVEGLIGDALVGARRMKDVLATLRELSRRDPGEPRRVSLVDCVESALRFTANELAQRAVVARDYRRHPEVLGHEGRLLQLFINLLLNAAQALPDRGPRGHITVRIDETADQAIVEVSDDGRGIPPETMLRIFEPFFTTRPPGGGSGLGLPIVRAVVQQHGGEVTVRSRPGVETTFRIALPRLDTTPAPAPAAAGEATRRRVLIVDDDALLRRLFQHLLDDEHDVVVAGSGEEALACIAAQPPDVVVCDLMMPGMTGIELHQRVRDANPALAARFLFVTGGAFTPDAESFVAAMGERVMFKPIAPAALLEAVQRVPR